MFQKVGSTKIRKSNESQTKRKGKSKLVILINLWSKSIFQSEYIIRKKTLERRFRPHNGCYNTFDVRSRWLWAWWERIYRGKISLLLKKLLVGNFVICGLVVSFDIVFKQQAYYIDQDSSYLIFIHEKLIFFPLYLFFQYSFS